MFSKAHKLVRIRIYGVLDKYKLNPTYWSILNATNHSEEGIRLTNVAALLEVKPPMVTTEAAVLINKGLIRRIPHHTDGRAKLLIVTPKGKKLAAHIEQELNGEIQQLVQGLTQEEIANFQKALETIISNSQKIT